jgi:hypothetical protein
VIFLGLQAAKGLAIEDMRKLKYVLAKRCRSLIHRWPHVSAGVSHTCWLPSALSLKKVLIGPRPGFSAMFMHLAAYAALPRIATIHKQPQLLSH